MAIKFPKTLVARGEILNPDDLIENASEVINEFNGSIDSDNLQNQPLKESYSAGTFHHTKSFRQPNTTPSSVPGSFVTEFNEFKCPHTTSAYVSRDDDNTQLAGVEIDAETDGWAIIDFNATFVWTGTGIVNVKMAQDLHMAGLYDEHAGSNNYLVSGIGLARTDMPVGGWMGVSGEYKANLHNPNTHGGRFDTKLQDSVGTKIHGLIEQNFPLGQWSDVPVDFYCVQFRIIVNGNLVAESGPLFNGNWRNSVYLCGAIPLVAGKNKIDAEVRAYTAVELKTSRNGVGARDAAGKRGKYFPFQTISSDVHPSPLPEYKPKSIPLDEIDERFNVKKDHDDLDAGIKCEIFDRHLIVQYRKR